MCILELTWNLNTADGLLWETTGSKLKAKDYGCIETSPKKATAERLKEIYEQISKIIGKYSPEVFFREELFFNTNAKSSLCGTGKRSYSFIRAENIFPPSVFTPLQVKIAITVSEGWKSCRLGKWLRRYLKLDKIPIPTDTAHALAVALTAVFSKKL